MVAGFKPLNLRSWANYSTTVLRLLADKTLFNNTQFSFLVPMVFTFEPLNLWSWANYSTNVLRLLADKTLFNDANFSFLLPVVGGFKPWNFWSWANCTTTVLHLTKLCIMMQKSLSRCLLWLDSNPQTYNHELIVLPLCYGFWQTRLCLMMQISLFTITLKY